jgi:hypothetical protein
MVARRPFLRRSPTLSSPRPGYAGDHKGPPNLPSPPSPLREGYFPQKDPVGELPKKAERSDGQFVGARFIAPAGPGGANVTQFANRVQKDVDPNAEAH